jgi:hypothetical protein
MATVITAPSAVRTVDMTTRGLDAGLGLELGFGTGEAAAPGWCGPTAVAVAGAALLAVDGGPAGLALQAVARHTAASDTAARDAEARSARPRRGRFTGRTRSTIEARCDGRMKR